MVHFYSLKIRSLVRDTRDAIVVSFDVPAELRQIFHYQPGQHLTLRKVIDGEELRRSYSICSAVQDDELKVAIKKVSGGAFSSWAHENFATGMTMDVMPPSGSFHLPLSPEHDRHYLAFAAGSGITPVFSIIKSTLLAEPRSRFTLVYGNRASSTVMMRDPLADLKDQFLDRLSVIHIMSREKQDIELFNGRIDADKCRALFSQWIRLEDIDHVFICGPQQMMEQVAATLVALGLDTSRIHAELFGVAAAVPRPRAAEAATDAQCDVTLVIDGRHYAFSMPRDAMPVLEAGLAQGIEIPYACKGGICATCRCKITEGKADMDANHALEDYEVASGFVLSCQAFPATDKLVLDFDQDA
ncbi:MAG: phenylacetate-CoA oxygenase/reductase subunit PaaK [Pseudomonadota bacterium]|jgi:ring-1,2-phenylacetyl-CoA epoxidase subunit PaaE